MLIPVKTVIIGPNAKFSRFCGGGSSSLNPYYAISPYEGIARNLDTDPSYTIGCYAHKELPVLGPLLTTQKCGGKPGIVFRAYTEPPTVKDRQAVDEITLTNTDMLLTDYTHPEIKDALWYAEIDGYLTAQEGGEFELGLCVYGAARLYVDGKEIIDNETTQTQGQVFYGCGTIEEKGSIEVKEGQTYHIKVLFSSAPASKLGAGGVVRFSGGGVRIGAVQF